MDDHIWCEAELFELDFYTFVYKCSENVESEGAAFRKTELADNKKTKKQAQIEELNHPNEVGRWSTFCADN